MKKWIILFALALLVVWGVYDLSQKNPLADGHHEQVESEEDDVPIGLNWGERAPDFTLSTLDGKETKLSDFRGKKVIMNFWASWCPPCIEEMPDMQRFYTDHQADDVVVLAVNLAETETGMGDVSSFIEQFKLTFPVIVDEESLVASLYQVRTIPTTYILNSKGIIEERITGPMTYDIMDELMGPIE